jgi:hypothetical protein
VSVYKSGGPSLLEEDQSLVLTTRLPKPDPLGARQLYNSRILRVEDMSSLVRIV